MNTKIFVSLAAFGTLVSFGVCQAAPTGTSFTPSTATNPAGGGAVQPSSVTGNASNWSATGTVDEFIQFTAIDSNLELGDLGGPKAMGEVVSLKVPGDPSSFSESGKGSGENGFAGIEFGSNAYIRVNSSHSRLRNKGPDGIRGTGNNTDDAILPTQFARAYFGREVKRNGTVLAGTSTGYVGYTTWSGLVSDSSTFNRVDFAPATTNGMRYRARVTRNGLNDYRGDYTTFINLTYYKY